MDLLEASIWIGDVLEDAAREHGVESRVLEGEPHGVGAELGIDLGVALERLDRRCLELLAVVECDHVDVPLAQQGRHLAVAATPVEQPPRPASGKLVRECPVLEHLRAGAQMHVGLSGDPSAHGGGWYETRVIDAVVATRDSRAMVLDCVERLRSPLLARVVVVDNGSEDGTAEAVCAASPDVVVVRVERPESLSFAYNRGAEAGNADKILFLNDDILATDEAIAELDRVLDVRADAVATAGRLVDPDDGRTQVDYQPRPFPTLTSFVATFAGIERLWPRNPITGRHRRWPLDVQSVVAVDYAPGACLLVRRSDFEAVGGWDERFEFWYEDVDLERRLSGRGRVLYVPTAPFAHVGGYSARRLSRAQLVARHYRGALLYGEKHFGRARQIGLALLFGTAGAARLLTTRRDPEQSDAYRSVVRAAIGLLR